MTKKKIPPTIPLRITFAEDDPIPPAPEPPIPESVEPEPVEPEPEPIPEIIEVVAELPRSPQPAKDRPLPVADPNPPSQFDEVIAENPGIEAMIKAKMIEMKVDPSIGFKEFFVLYLWKMMLSDNLKEVELAARILGRGYIGENQQEKTSEKLFIENYDEDVAKMLGKKKGGEE